MNLREWIARLAELKYEEGALSVFIEGALRGHEEMTAALVAVGPPPVAAQPVTPEPPARPSVGRPKGATSRTDKVLAALRSGVKPLSVHELKALLADEPVHALRACLYELRKTHRAVATHDNGEVRWASVSRGTSPPGPGQPTGES